MRQAAVRLGLCVSERGGGPCRFASWHRRVDGLAAILWDAEQERRFLISGLVWVCVCVGLSVWVCLCVCVSVRSDRASVASHRRLKKLFEETSYIERHFKNRPTWSVLGVHIPSPGCRMPCWEGSAVLMVCRGWG